MKLRPSTIAWLAVPAGLVAVAATLCATGLYAGGAAGIVCLVICALVAAALMVARERLVSAACAWLEHRGLSGGRGRAVLVGLLVAAISVCAFFSLEVSYADGGMVAVGLPYALLELVLIALFLLVLLGVFQGSGTGLALGSLALVELLRNGVGVGPQSYKPARGFKRLLARRRRRELARVGCYAHKKQVRRPARNFCPDFGRAKGYYLGSGSCRLVYAHYLCIACARFVVVYAGVDIPELFL